MKVSPTQYARTLLELTENKSEQEVSVVVKKFAEQLKKDGQMKNIRAIMEKFSDLHDKAHGRVIAHVTSRTLMTQDALAKVESFVMEKYDAKEVIIENIVDMNIKGGVVIRVGDEILDGSIKKQLDNLKKVLIG
jgi:F-type H+-transporting ATPase subunit delta